MDLFFKLDDHLSKKLKDACNNFNNFVRIQLSRLPSEIGLNEAEVTRIYDSIADSIKSQHKQDCKIFIDSPNFFVERDQSLDFIYIVNNVVARNLREIDNLRVYKLTLVKEKLKRENLEYIDRFTFIEWISRN